MRQSPQPCVLAVPVAAGRCSRAVLCVPAHAWVGEGPLRAQDEERCVLQGRPVVAWCDAQRAAVALPRASAGGGVIQGLGGE